MITEKFGRDIGEFPVFWRRDAEFCILKRHFMRLVRDLFLFLRKNKLRKCELTCERTADFKWGFTCFDMGLSFADAGFEVSECAQNVNRKKSPR